MPRKSSAPRPSTPKWIPDWRDRDQYPPEKGTLPIEWAWQFIRRNPVYQLWWEVFIAPYMDQTGKIDFEAATKKMFRLSTLKKVGMCREDVENFETVVDFFKWKFGIQPAPFWFNLNRVQIICVFGPIGPYLSKVTDIKRARQNVRVTKPYEIIVHFDLRTPIEGQLSFARKTLADAVKALQNGRGPKKARLRGLMYSNYLRVLDAKAAGASNKAIATVLFPKMPNQAGDYAGSKHVIDVEKTAIRLRDHDYMLVANMLTHRNTV